jgi:hypothetical protein
LAALSAELALARSESRKVPVFGRKWDQILSGGGLIGVRAVGTGQMLAFGPILWYKPRTHWGSRYVLKPGHWIDVVRRGYE